MATLTMFFPGGVYPQGYAPPIPGFDYNPTLGELLSFTGSTTVSTSATQMTIQLANGLKVKLIGAGFTFDVNGDPTGGTISSLQLLQNNGVTLVQTLTGLSVSLENFDLATDFANPFDVLYLLLAGNDTLNGSAGDDDIQSADGNDVLNGGAGNDFLVGGKGDDAYNGGAGFDTLSFQDVYWNRSSLTGITLNAATGTVIDPWGNSETFTSIEEFRGTPFADSITGSAASEDFMGLGGRDTIIGGAGFDFVQYDRDFQQGGTLGVTVNLVTGVAFDGWGKQDTLVGIEGVVGTNSNDVILGSSISNDLYGLGGNDVLSGFGGADYMAGGTGNDSYVVDNAGDFIDEAFDNGSGTDRVNSSISFSLANPGQIAGAVENLTLTGANNISGTGNGLANAILGNTGNNTLNGGAGDDVLSGGLGNDTLIGGANGDTFVFETALNALTNKDIITDFNVAEDTIRLENAIFTAIVGTGTLTAAQFASNATGVALDGDDRVIYNTTTGNLLYDADGNGAGAAIVFATLNSTPAVTFADFVVV